MHSKFLLTSILSLALLSKATSTPQSSSAPSYGSSDTSVGVAASPEAQEGVGAYFISSSSEGKTATDYSTVAEKKKGGEEYEGAGGLGGGEYGDGYGAEKPEGYGGEKGHGEEEYGAEKGYGGEYGYEYGYGDEGKGDVSIIKIIQEKTIFVDKMCVVLSAPPALY